VATISNLLLVLWALHAGLGLVGVTGSLMVSRVIDMVFRWIQYQRRFPKAEPGPEPEYEGGRLRERMTRFYWQSSLLMILNMVVWDRSEMLFLKYFCPIIQVAYYSLAFNISAQFLNFPQIFSEAASATLMVEYGRDPKVTGFLTATTVRYICLFAFPLLFGMAATSPAVIQILYGSKYLPTIPVLTLSCVFALPRAMMLPVRQQLMTHERQAFLVVWGLITAVINGAVDWALIPRGGALGAALGNGLAQGIASVGIVVYGIRKLDVRLDWGSLLKMLLSASLMAAVAYPICQVLRPIPAALVAVPAGAAVYLAMLRWSGALATEDLRRLATVGDKLPFRLRGFYRMLLEKLIAVPEAVASQSA